MEREIIRRKKEENVLINFLSTHPNFVSNRDIMNLLGKIN